MTETGERTDRPRPRKRARSVSYWMTPPVSSSTAATWAAQIGCSSAGPWAAGRQEGADLGDELGLHEQVLEGRVRDVGRLRREGDLRVRRQLDLASVRAEVGQRHAADLRVVLRRHDDGQAGRDRAVATGELGVILRVGDLVAVRLRAAGLVARRPHRAGVHVAQEEIAAPRVAGHVLAPAGHRHVAPAAVAGSRGRHHDRVPPVRQQVRPRDRVVGRGESTEDRRHEIAHVGGALHLFGTRPGHEHVARHPLLEQQLRRLDDRVGMEALDHRAVVEDVAEGHQRHPLVMGHVALHDRDRRALRGAGAPCSRAPPGSRTARPLRRRSTGRSSGPRPRAGSSLRGRSRTGRRRRPRSGPASGRGRARRSSSTGRSARGRAR